MNTAKPRYLPADPRAGYLAAEAEIDAAIRRVMHSGHYILGPETEAFEREFAAWLGTAGCVGVANGTDALELALRAAGIGPGDKVVTVANTVSATAAAIVATGATPLYAEIEPGTMLLDVAALAAFLETRRDPRIKAVVPVHLYGQAVDLPRLMEIAAAHHLTVIEDCAQAHGAEVAGRKAGAWGHLAAFSFYPTKNLGAFGDGGAVVGSDPAALEKVRLWRQYGWRRRYVSDQPGRNSRLDELQAAILRVRLPRLDAENAQRAGLAARYAERLLESGLILPVTATGRRHVWHQYVVRHPRRDELKAWLETRGVVSGVLYPVPLHRQPAFHRPELSLPATEAACAEVLSLPLHPGLGRADIDSICDMVLAAPAFA
ncbi:dTDP-3-amino-3,6-dideoxy-alpha-D-galactopyranose transaminase [Lacunisphaera limnophila]|uniref:dTDP-3-amino-3,6-dideoxy-alpha-D-galactopyranose transaminase n=1 Tax=Lacunisphaera limnophila TaxID=1838286 RepID=A0A1D8AVM8_9BACT|nr:DegT/DnrJ/EryC1/StrS family aminotransferase [Lacunisphaera limnophila]AOS44933.1 dTDP-3-amino-3,6-dideoxy-alpha-D-galactopyranose transaminase [Lacunisphaera limnophila]